MQSSPHAPNLELTEKRIPRKVKCVCSGVVQNKTVHITTAKCPRCGHEERILPSDVPAYKNYTVGVHEQVLRLYLQDQKTSLRKVSDDLSGEEEEETMWFQTVHRMTEAFGAYVRGSIHSWAGGKTAAAIATSLLEVFPERHSVWTQTPFINPHRYHQKENGRKERLEAGTRFLNLLEPDGMTGTNLRLKDLEGLAAIPIQFPSFFTPVLS